MLQSIRLLTAHSNQQLQPTLDKVLLPVKTASREDSSSKITDADTLPYSTLSQQQSDVHAESAADQPSNHSLDRHLLPATPGKSAREDLSKAEQSKNLLNLVDPGSSSKKAGEQSVLLHPPISVLNSEGKEIGTGSQSPSRLAVPAVDAGASAGPQREGLTGTARPDPSRPVTVKPHHETKSGVREREDAEILLGSIVGKEWLVDRKIASGSFGTLFLGRNISTKEPVAIKAERRDSTFPQLHREKKFYQMLANGEGIPRMLYYGECSTGNRYQILVMDLLGPNVEDLLQACGGRFSLKTTCMVACQLLTRMEYSHSKGILYRDIKSENFLIGRRKEPNHNVLHVVDFGLSKEYINPVSKQHIAFNVKKGSVGTPRYMSINALQHHEQGRRDDLEALSYLFLYLYLGHLPWQGLPGSTFAEKCKRILEKKLKITVDEVCHEAPAEFGLFMKYARNLDFEAKPDYNYCRQLFLDMMKKTDTDFDNVYDWSTQVPTFWQEREKLLDGLSVLPDDLLARVRAAEANDVPFNIRSSRSRGNYAKSPRTGRSTESKGRTRKKSGARCCACCASLKLRFSGGASRRNSNMTVD